MFPMPAAFDVGQGLNNAFSTVASFVPKLVLFAVILLIGLLVAKAVEKIIDKVLERVGFDRLVERGGLKKALAGSKYDASSILSKIVYYAIMLFVFSTAFGVFGPNPISTYLTAIIAYLPLVFVAILIIVISAAIAAAVKVLIQSTLGGLSYGKTLANLASFVIIALGVTAALGQLHVATNVVNAVLYAALAAVVGIAVVAIGGGGISPMKARWEKTLSAYDEEKPKMAQAASNAPSVLDQAREAGAEARSAATDRAPRRGATRR